MCCLLRICCNPCTSTNGVVALLCSLCQPLICRAWSADPRAEEIRQFASKVPIVTYSTIARTADVYARNMKFTPWESEVEVRTQRLGPFYASRQACMQIPASPCL